MSDDVTYKVERIVDEIREINRTLESVSNKLHSLETEAYNLKSAVDQLQRMKDTK
jgi:prefoldin subunit 5